MRTAAASTLDDRMQELVGAERTLVVIRWFAILFAAVQVSVYENMPYPPGVEVMGLALAGLLALTNLATMLTLPRVRTPRGATLLVLGSLGADTAVAVSYVWLYTFDNESTWFLLLFILPAEAALKFRLTGALGLWGAVTALYVVREAWGAARYGFELSAPSIAYRMGILLIVSLMFGLFARRIAQQVDELANAIEGLEREKRWRSALIDMLAHDFRSPVGSATSALQLVERRVDEMTEKQLQEVVTGAIRQNRRALALADDILALAKAGHGHLQLSRQEVELEPLLADVVASLGMRDAVGIETPDGLRCHVDQARLVQIVTNLLSNARKHGRPPISITAVELPDNGLELRVSDAGDGVPKGQQAGLFRQFASGPRADSVGLGLWLVATLAEAHGGGAAYEQRDGRPTFVVQLPGGGAATTASGQPVQVRRSSRR